VGIRHAALQHGNWLSTMAVREFLLRFAQLATALAEARVNDK